MSIFKDFFHVKQSPILSMLGFGGGGTGTALGGAVAAPVLYTITKSSSHDNWKEGNGLGHQNCSGDDRTGVSTASSTLVTMTLAVSPTIPTITEFKLCLRTPNGTNIDYRFNGTGSFASTGVGGGGNTETVWDATSIAPSTVSQLELRGGGGSGNTHVYVYYIKVNGVYFSGNSATTYTATF